MDLNKSLETLKFDIRMKDFNMKHGNLTKEELEKNQAALEDSQNSCEPVTLEDKADFGD